jgi:hypothetical protein
MCTLKKVFFFNIIVTNDENDEKNLNIFYINLHPFCFFFIEFEFHSIQSKLNWIWIEID